MGANITHLSAYSCVYIYILTKMIEDFVPFNLRSFAFSSLSLATVSISPPRVFRRLPLLVSLLPFFVFVLFVCISGLESNKFVCISVSRLQVSFFCFCNLVCENLWCNVACQADLWKYVIFAIWFVKNSSFCWLNAGFFIYMWCLTYTKYLDFRQSNLQKFLSFNIYSRRMNPTYPSALEWIRAALASYGWADGWLNSLSIEGRYGSGLALKSTRIGAVLSLSFETHEPFTETHGSLSQLFLNKLSTKV